MSANNMKISQFLYEYTDSHAIQDSTKLKEAFALNIAKDQYIVPDWPEHSSQETARAINARGKGGELKQDAESVKVILCYGFEVAEFFARKLTDFKPWQSGLGFRFRSAVQALAEKGY